MKKILLIILVAVSATGCEKFLDKTPSEGGLVGFNNAGQFEALLNEIRLTRNRFEWNHAILASDDCHFHPDFQTANIAYQDREAFNIWDQPILTGQTTTSNGFVTAFFYMYNLNYITDNIDKPEIEGSIIQKKKVKGEAMYTRAFYYFNLLVQYAMHPGLNNGQYPGLGYKNTTSAAPESYNDRKTVKYTLDKIFEDLDASEALLNESGATDFKILEPWRVSLPTLYAFRARVELYAGNYQKAFQYARRAYQAHSFLYDMNNNALFAMVNRGTAQTEVVNGVTISVFNQSPAILTNAGNTTDPQSNSLYWYREAYYRAVCQLAAANKLPPSADLYALYDAQDIRKKVWYDNNMNINTSSLFKPSRKDELVSKSYMKHGVSATTSGYLLGPTVPEIMLIMAECRARGVGSGDDASTILKALRRTRFPVGYVDNIGGSLKEVKDERRRELSFTLRWYDLKRYNALDNDNITVRKLGRRDVYQLNSDIVTWVLEPNALAYAQPIPQPEVERLGWKQNEYGGVRIQ
jgi:hypothetical protein